MTKLPPGTAGLPLLGETLAFSGDSFAFVADRAAKHGTVFRTHIVGLPAAIVVGPDAGAMFLDEENCTRVGSQPPHIARLFNGESLPALDGERHQTRKHLVMAAFTPAALASYVPGMRAILDAAIDRWIAAGEIGWSDELEKLAMRTVATNFLGLDDAAALDLLRADYQAMVAAFAAIPVNVPGTKLSRGLAAVSRLHERLLAIVRARRAEPRDDGISRILAATAPDGSRIDDEAAAREAHHLIVAGYIVFAEFAMGVVELARRPELRAALEDCAGDSRALLMNEALQRFVMEVKRVTPVVPFVLGKARKDIDFGGFTIPAGWLLLWAVPASHQIASLYPNPGSFDPERFGPGREEHLAHPHAFAPQGLGGPMTHRCAGVEYTTLFMSVFFSEVLRRMRWELPEQDMELDGSKTPPVRRGGLRARVTAR